MRHNNRPVMKASTLAPQLLDLREGWRPLVACPDCGNWTIVKRGLLSVHRDHDQLHNVVSVRNGKVVAPRRVEWDLPRCPGSGQRIRIDLTVDEWRSSLNEAALEASS